MKQIIRKCCGYANKYKIIRKPTCGCGLCTFLWEVKHSKDQLLNFFCGYSVFVTISIGG